MDFATLQAERLEVGWRADLPGSTTPHVMLALPSYSVDRSLYRHYGDRVPALENRYLYVAIRARDPATRVVYLSSRPVPDGLLDGYLGLLGDDVAPDDVLSRVLLVSPDDTSPRSLAEKALDRGDLIDELRRCIGDQPALIEAWNVTEAEAALAVALGAPIHGTDPGLRFLATKSNGRRLLRDAGVPVPDGVEDVRTVADVARAVDVLRRRQPRLGSVVVKLDDSVAGDGNVVVPLPALAREDGGEPLAGRQAQAGEAVAAMLPAWYQDALAAGGVVEERIEGEDFRSPSAQATITPTGDVQVLSTHEQRLGGSNGQVFEGCVLPADPGYAATLSECIGRVGRRLASLGACGRFAVDFVACRGHDGWRLFALEINLRKGGTTHPYGVARLLSGTRFDPSSGTCRTAAGQPLAYRATDNLVDERWRGAAPADVHRRIAASGVAFDRRTGEGVVPHLLDGLAIDARMGYTVIARSPEAAERIEERLLAALREGR